ncbi:VOC family protein [Agriterribacter sp.]|uniref:VOC family protein n=1 Tax=Agriterribacter sp. TaxID=2821509 RepID=UPI002C035242|nr:VOC family protein [Agriterribacter sp.]HRO44358.1 VOC family protein [Agriterribacter sp.]HRQ16674.1 VOC family protein [Agriterribacter sp.]
MTSTGKTPTYGLTHIAVAVKDLSKTKNFYQTVFDMEIMYEEADFIQLSTPGSHDILVFEKNGNANGESGGIKHFGFRLRKPEDISVMEKKILNAGGQIVHKGEFAPGSPYIFFKDPDGYEIEIWYELVP